MLWPESTLLLFSSASTGQASHLYTGDPLSQCSENMVMIQSFEAAEHDVHTMRLFSARSNLRIKK